jgi:hypothetical protein
MGGFAFSLPSLCDLSALCGYPSATDSLIRLLTEVEAEGGAELGDFGFEDRE